MGNIKKAYEITDAKIQFISLVDKAANKKRFLITKAEDGKAGFTAYGRIIKADSENHYVTGIVYEPMTEDAHGNYMTEEEITKAAYYFIKKGNKIDLQHNFEPLTTATVVENWIAKSDTAIEGEAIKKGTWLMTVEVTDKDMWDAIEKGEITGLSMGGVGAYSEEDVDLEDINKGAGEDKIGLLSKIAKAMGIKSIQKGIVAEQFKERSKGEMFWQAWNTLDTCLRHYDYMKDRYVYETDEDKIRECLSDFSEIIVEILAENTIAKTLSEGGEAVQKSLVIKAGKKMSGKNKETLQGIYESLGSFIKEFDEVSEENKEKEESEVTKSDVEQIVSAVVKALDSKKSEPKSETPEAGEGKKPAETAVRKNAEITPESISDMVNAAVEAAVAKAVTPSLLSEEGENSVAPESIQKMVESSVAKAIEPVLKARGIPYNLGDGETVQKSDEHYMHGIL